MQHANYHHQSLTCPVLFFRYSLRAISDEQIRKVNIKIDEKLVRRHQQQYEREHKPKPKQQTSTESSPTLITPSNNQEHSIFRDPPTTNSLPTKIGVIIIIISLKSCQIDLLACLI